VTRAPDHLEPVVGWRVWDVVDLDGELRLCSLNFWTVWLPGQGTTAVCRRALADLNRAGLPPHAAPEAGCTCGIYAARTAGHVLSHARRFRLRADAVHRVVGRVRLWGEVVEADRGWRGEHAYPETLFVPTARGGMPRPGRLPAPRRSVEQVGLGLAAYAVPVEIVDCGTYPRLAALLEPRSPA
jgi:hypothetical protein